MFSIMSRIRTCAIRRLLLFLTTTTFMCAALITTPLAHSPKPTAVAGDADDLGGIRDSQSVESNRNHPGASLASSGYWQDTNARKDGTLRVMIWWSEIYFVMVIR